MGVRPSTKAVVFHRTTRLASLALTVLFVLVSCASAENDAGGGGAGTADPVSADSFCVLWAEMKTHMDDSEGVDQDGLSAYLDAREVAAAEVPDELAGEWASIIAWDDQMIEILYAIDFDQEAVTEEIVAAAFGSVEDAEAAEAAQETAVAQIERWVVRNCGGGVSDALAFCDVWTEIFLSLEGHDQDPNIDPESEEAQNRFADLVARADAVAPPEVREQWDPIAEYSLTRHDLLVTVNFDESLLSDDLLTDAFGSPEAAATAAADAESSVAAVESWAATGCGDFCARSRELTEAMGELGGPLDERASDTYRFALGKRLLAHADVLMPDDLRVYWEPVSDELYDWMGWWERHDYDRQQLNTSEAQAEAIEIYRQAEYRSYLGEDPERDAERTAAIEAWRAGEADLTEDAAQRVAELASAPLWERPGFGGAVWEIEQWAARNCEHEAGGPGVVEVGFGEITGAAGDQLVLVMGPVGSTVENLGTPEQFSFGVPCVGVDRDPWGVFLGGEGEDGQPERQYWGQMLRSRPAEGVDNELCDWHGENALVDPGDYTLVAARYKGATPRPDVDAPPTHCLALDVTVSGDAVIDLPELPECDLDLAPPEPGDWGYTEPVSASTSGAGTLKVRIPSQVAPDAREIEGGGRYHLQATALPHGTTLNEVGREQVFPPAGGCVWLWPERTVPDELEMRPVELPLGSLPSEGLATCLDPDWLNGAAPLPGAPPGEPADDSSLPLTVLSPGVYDVYVRGFSEGWSHEGSCTKFEVVVDGDTVVDLPVDLAELERC